MHSLLLIYFGESIGRRTVVILQLEAKVTMLVSSKWICALQEAES